MNLFSFVLGLTFKVHTESTASADSTSTSTASSSSRESSVSPTRYRDELALDSFRNKLKKFENLTTPQSPEEKTMSSFPVNPHKFSYMNYVGEKLFTKDTNTTRLSMGESDPPTSAGKPNGHPPQNELPIKPPKPEIKPKPAITKTKPRLENRSSGGGSSSSPTGSRSEFKTLSMISTETSIWGSTSSAGTFKLEDEPPSPLSCHTPTELELLDDADVFSDEMTNSFSLKHQQMVSRRIELFYFFTINIVKLFHTK